MNERNSNEPFRPLYEYKVDTVGNLLLCLKPHVLREIRDNLVERELDFNGERAKQEASALIQHIEELLVSLDGEA